MVTIKPIDAAECFTHRIVELTGGRRAFELVKRKDDSHQSTLITRKLDFSQKRSAFKMRNTFMPPWSTIS